MRLLRVLRTILWSLFGVRRAADSARDLEGVTPVTIIAVAVALVALLVVVAVTLIRLLVPAPSASREAEEQVAPARQR